MPNPFSKRTEADKPYAIYTCSNMVWHVRKTYKQPSSEAKDPYARWLVSAKSDATFGAFESGDNYAQEVPRYGWLVACTPEWAEHYGLVGMEYPTPEEYLANA